MNPASATLAPALDDFPDWVDPMVVKELRQGMRARLFLVPFAGIHVLAVVAVLVENLSTAALADGDGGPASGFVQTGLLWTLASFVLLAVLPLRGWSALEEEMHGSNVELVVTTRLSRWRIVLGKWLVICAQSWLVLVSLLPYFLVRYFNGGLDVWQNVFGLGTLAALNATAGALVVGASSFEGLIARTLIGVGGVLACYFMNGTLAIVVLFAIAGTEGGIGLLFAAGAGVLMLSQCLLYTVYGLQLGRCRVMARARPWESELGKGIVVLIFVSPFILGILSGFTFMLGGIVASLVTAVLILRSTRRRPPPPAPGTSPDPGRRIA